MNAEEKSTAAQTAKAPSGTSSAPRPPEERVFTREQEKFQNAAAAEQRQDVTVNVNITMEGMTVREEADIEKLAAQLASRLEQAAYLF